METLRYLRKNDSAMQYVFFSTSFSMTIIQVTCKNYLTYVGGHRLSINDHPIFFLALYRWRHLHETFFFGHAKNTKPLVDRTSDYEKKHHTTHHLPIN